MEDPRREGKPKHLKDRRVNQGRRGKRAGQEIGQKVRGRWWGDDTRSERSECHMGEMLVKRAGHNIHWKHQKVRWGFVGREGRTEDQKNQKVGWGSGESRNIKDSERSIRSSDGGVRREGKSEGR